MNYETIYLSVDKGTARNCIAERGMDVRARADGNRIEYRSNTGHVLAVLTDETLPSGEEGSKLRYRTAIISGHHIHARTAARKIRDAVERYRIE